MVLLLQYTLIFASVLMLVALGGCFSEHSGVINLGLEGIMVIGALGGALAMRYMSSLPPFLMVVVVLLCAIAAGVVYSSLLAVACINFKADQTIVGTALNLLGTAGALPLLLRPSTPPPTLTTCPPPSSMWSRKKPLLPAGVILSLTGSWSLPW